MYGAGYVVGAADVYVAGHLAWPPCMQVMASPVAAEKALLRFQRTSA